MNEFVIWLRGLESSDWISVASIISTICISIFVQRATSKSAEATVKTAKLTEQMMILNKIIFESQREEKEDFRRSLRYQYIRILINKASEIINAISSSNGLDILNNLSGLDVHHHITPENLALCFDEQSVLRITDAWTLIYEYKVNRVEAAVAGNMHLLVEAARHPLEQFDNLSQFLHNLKKEIDH